MLGELTKLMCHPRTPAFCRQSARVPLQEKKQQLYCKSADAVEAPLVFQSCTKETDGQEHNINWGM